MIFLTEAEHEELSRQFLDKRVRLINCRDEHTFLKPGDEGVVNFIDGTGTLHVAWDSGSYLGLIPGIDEWELME